MIELGLIDEVKYAEELGLEHLLREPPQLMVSLMGNIRRARAAVTQLPENLQVAVPLGTNHPVSIGQLRNDDGGTTRFVSNLEAVGTVNPQGEAEPITPKDEGGMFAQEERDGGTLRNVDNLHQTLVADASGSFFQAQSVPVLDLIVHEKSTGAIYLVPNILADAFCRDALNAVLTGTQHRNNIDLRRLRRLR